jgi:putative membrane protein
MPAHPDYLWWGGMWIFPIITILFFLVVVYLLFGKTGLRRGHYPDRDPIERTNLESPIDILKRRYARGEITKEEFDQMRKDLSG